MPRCSTPLATCSAAGTTAAFRTAILQLTARRTHSDEPDASGQNQYISSSYLIEAVPAFITHPNADKTSMMMGPPNSEKVRLAQTH